MRCAASASEPALLSELLGSAQAKAQDWLRERPAM